MSTETSSEISIRKEHNKKLEFIDFQNFELFNQRKEPEVYKQI